MSLPILYFSDQKRELNFCNGYLSLLYFCCAVSVTFSLSIVTVNLLPKTFGRQYHIGVKFFHKQNLLFLVFHNSFIMNAIREIIPSHPRLYVGAKKWTRFPDFPNGLSKKITEKTHLKPFRKNDKIGETFWKIFLMSLYLH